MIMSGFHVYNITKEEHFGENSFYCGRGSVLRNPYTHIKDKETKARYVVKDRDEAIDRYSGYFDVMYGGNKEFTKAVDEIYSLYKAGKDVYLGCYCKPQRCHCDVIVDKLRKRLVKEKISYIKKNIE
jgi:hypothetical protein